MSPVSWLPNLALIKALFAASGVPWLTRARLLASLLGGIGTSFDPTVAAATTAAVLLFGMDIAMIVYFVRARHALPGHEMAAGVGGAIAGAAAAGCAACGSLALFAVLSSFGAAGALAFLPLSGGELSLLSVALLAVSICLIARCIVAALVCEIPRSSPGRAAG